MSYLKKGTVGYFFHIGENSSNANPTHPEQISPLMIPILWKETLILLLVKFQ